MVKEKQILQLIGDLRGHFDFSSEDINNFILGLITLKHLEENNSEITVSENYSWANCSGRLEEGVWIFQDAFLELERNNPFLEGVFSELFLPKLNVEQLRVLTFFINALPGIPYLNRLNISNSISIDFQFTEKGGVIIT